MRKIMKISNYMLAFLLISLLPFLRIVNDPNKTVSVFKDSYIYELDYKMQDGTTVRSIFDEQLVTNGDFSDGATGWINNNLETFTVANGEAYIVENESNGYIRKDFTTVANDKHYFYAFAKGTSNFNLNSYGFELADSLISLTSNYQLSSSIVNNITLPNWRIYLQLKTSGNATIRESGAFNIQTLIENKQYSPLYDTTFDLMTDIQIKNQMDEWIEVYQEHKDDLELLFFNNMLSDNNPDNYTPFELGKYYIEEGIFQFIPRNTTVREGQHRLTKFKWPFLDNLLYLFSEGMELLFVPVYNVLADNIPILPSIKDTSNSIEEGVNEFYMGKTIIGSNLQDYTLNYYDNYTGSNWIVEDVAGWEQYKVVFNTYEGIYNLSNTIFNGRFKRSSLDLEIIDDYTVVNLYYDSLNDLYIFQLRPDGFLNKHIYKYATDLELKEFFMIS